MEPYVPRVLVADHELAVTDTFVQIFRMCGYDAMAVRSGEEAVEVASTYLPDVALLDVMLPGNLNGIEAAQIIVKENPRCRIILCSGRPETAALVDKASAAGSLVEVFPKPVHPSVILKIIADAVADRAPQTNDFSEENLTSSEQ